MAVQIPFPLPAKGFALNSKVRVNLDFIVSKFNEFNTGAATWDAVYIGTANSASGHITLYNSSNTNYLKIQPGATAASITYTLPATAPADVNKLLTGGDDGVMAWTQHSWSPSTTLYGILYHTTANVGTLSYNGDNLSSRAFAAIESVGTAPILVDLKGTADQVTVTNNTYDTTLSLPQSIATTSVVQFASLVTGAGAVATPSLFMGSVSVLGDRGGHGFYTGAGTLYGVAYTDTSPGQTETVLFESNATTFKSNYDITLAATRNIILTDDTTNTVTIALPGAVTTYTLTLPTTAGTNTYVLQTNGSGTLSWVDPTSFAPAGGATIALDNLASVAINTSLISDTDVTDSLGSADIFWHTVYTRYLQVGKTGAVGRIRLYPTDATSGYWEFNPIANSGDYELGITNAAQAGHRTYTIPDAGGNASFVMTAGTQTIGGAKTFSSDVTLAAEKNIILTDDTTNTVTIALPAAVTTYTLTLPANDGDADQVLSTNGSGVTSWVTPASGGTVYREDYVVGTALNNYTGSTTVFDLNATYATGDGSMLVYVDGVLQTIGATVDYVETDTNTITFNNALIAGQKVGFVWSVPTSGTDYATKALDNLASVAINTSLVSDTNNTDDLGSSTKAWKDLYLTGSIKQGATTCITTSSAGEVTQPNQPSFLAYNSATDSNVTGDGTDYTVDFDTEVFDQGSDFATDTFTSPVTGKYLLTCKVTLAEITSSHTYLRVTLVTSNRSYISEWALGHNSSYYTIDTNNLVDMDANDTAYVSVHVNGSTKSIDSYGDASNYYTTFSGSLIN